MLRPPLQELDCFGECHQASSRYREFSRPPLARAQGNCTPWSGSFTSWCGGRQLDPVNCPIGTVLEFLQACSSAGLTHSTQKVYVAALLAYHAPLGGQSVGRHPLVTRFLQRLRPLARELMLCGGSGCYSIASSTLFSPLLGGQNSLLRSWPSGRRPHPL